jgi:hypothetical protein
VKLSYNTMSCISYILETERNHFEEYLSSFNQDDEEVKLLLKLLENNSLEGIEIDYQTETLLKEHNHVFGLAVLAINGR